MLACVIVVKNLSMSFNQHQGTTNSVVKRRNATRKQIRQLKQYSTSYVKHYTYKYCITKRNYLKLKRLTQTISTYKNGYGGIKILQTLRIFEQSGLVQSSLRRTGNLPDIICLSREAKTGIEMGIHDIEWWLNEHTKPR